jgi:hypothetical protein
MDTAAAETLNFDADPPGSLPPEPRNVWHALDDDRIAGPGAVGLWTKADSVIAFDDFSYGAKVRN